MREGREGGEWREGGRVSGWVVMREGRREDEEGREGGREEGGRKEGHLLTC